MYASVLNSSTWFSFLVISVTVAGLGTGLGVALVEATIIMLVTGKTGRSYLKLAQIPQRFVLAHHSRNFQLAMSGEKMRMVSVLIIGMMAPAYWIARPLYVFSNFAEYVPKYLTLARATGPTMPFVQEDTKEEEESTREQQIGRDDDAPEQPQFGNESPSPSPSKQESRAETRAKPVGPNGLPVTGKIMPVDVVRGAIDPVYFDLSSDLRPKRPDEVGAVAALWWSKVQVGAYSGSNEGAFQQHCTVMVLDKRTKSLLAERSFVGSKPPRWSLHGFPQSGSRPYAEIKDFLNSLPHR